MGNLLYSFILLLFFSLPVFSGDFHSSRFVPQSLVNLEEKEMGRVSTHDGLELQILEIGPEKGKPAIAVTGYASNAAYYLPTAMKLVETGHRVYIFSPRGLGADFLKHQGESSIEQAFRVEFMAEDFHHVLKYVSNKHPEQKIASFGHSMGGIILRLAEMGLRVDQRGHAYIDRNAKLAFLKKVSMKVLTSSPSFGLDEVSEKEKQRMEQFLNLSPHIIRLKNTFSGLIHFGMSRPLISKGIQLSTQGLGKLNASLGGIIDPSHMSAEEFSEFVRYSSAENIPKELKNQLAFFLFNKEGPILESPHGTLDFNSRYFNTNYILRVPTLVIGNEKDHLARVTVLEQEVEFLKRIGVPVEYIKLPGGHMNSMYGAKNVSRVISSYQSFLAEQHLASIRCNLAL